MTSPGTLRETFREALRREWLFAALVATFAAIYLAQYPATFAIADECEILSLAYSIDHGTFFPDQAGLATYNSNFEVPTGGHRIIIYSPSHAALLAPALRVDWKLDFLLAAGFLILGAFAIRAMLVREGFSSDWCILYFLLAGMLYYSRTLLAAVPATVMVLLAVSTLTGDRQRPLLGGLAFGAAVLLHPWMAFFAIPFSVVWWLEGGAENRLPRALALATGALPAILVLGVYNYLTTGAPYRSGYVILGYEFWFAGKSFIAYFPFYLASLAIFPIAGLSVLSPRWSRGWALPVSAAVMIVTASLYRYRDGLTSDFSGVVALIAGAIPGQRFLLPVSVVACVPAARWLSSRFALPAANWPAALRLAALAVFVVGFAGLSALHQNYLRAQAKVQTALAAALPPGAQVVDVDDGDSLKELAPVYELVAYRRDESGAARQARDAYRVWIGAPGAAPPTAISASPRIEMVPARSWVWKRDLWIAWPNQ